MHHSEIIISTVVEKADLTLEQLASLCAVKPDWVLQHIEEGLIRSVKLENGDQRFNVTELTRAKRILAIEQNFDAVPELAALVADMQEEMEELRRQLERMIQK